MSPLDGIKLLEAIRRAAIAYQKPWTSERDPKMHLLFCTLFLSLIIDGPLANEINSNLKLQKRSVKKSPPQLIPDETHIAQDQNDDIPHSSRNVIVFYETTMSWTLFPGSVPTGAVSHWNSYAGRWEYPCIERGCVAGYYSPSRGPYCYYPYGNKEYSTSEFWILVNGHDFESLSWKGGSWGKVPPNSINTCAGINLFVGKNKYGLGKVDSKNQAFFLGWNGKEYWYKHYDVLTINKDYRSQSISNVNYELNQGSYSEGGISIVSSKVTNHDCRTVKKSTTLSGTVTSEHSWDVGISFSQGIGFTMTAGIPEVFGISWGISSEKTFNWMKGYTQSESITYSDTVEVEVPPNHSCELEMGGMKMRASIPFNAIATRYYHSGATRIAPIQGTSHNAVVAQ
ncbi:hypothetical protein Chor_009236, partial [Crotalus horridus]